jgi:hypothetical protein
MPSLCHVLHPRTVVATHQTVAGLRRKLVAHLLQSQLDDPPGQDQMALSTEQRLDSIRPSESQHHLEFLVDDQAETHNEVLAVEQLSVQPHERKTTQQLQFRQLQKYAQAHSRCAYKEVKQVSR